MPSHTYTDAELDALAQQLAPAIGRYLKLPAPDAPDEPQEPTPPPEVEPDEPEPEPPAPTPVPPSGELRGTLPKSYRWDAEQGITPPWHKVSTAGNVLTKAIQVIDDPLGKRGKVWRFENSAGQERVEVASNPNGLIRHSDAYWWAFWLLLPDDYQVTASFQIVGQLHGVDDKLSPPVSFRTTKEGIVLRCRGAAIHDKPRDFLISPGLNIGQWQQIALGAVSHSDPAIGRVQCRHRLDGQPWRVACDAYVETSHAHQEGEYLRHGIYGTPKTNTTLYIADVRLGNSFEEVAAR